MTRKRRFLKCLLVLLLTGLGLVALFDCILNWLRRRKPPKPSRFAAPTQADCQPVPSHIYRRPDPMVYDQQYLMSQGLAVTWDNPDITVELGGVAVDPHDLAPDTVYDVVARVWNGSVDAPAINLPVQFSYLSFGIGTHKHPIPGLTMVDLGAKGAAGCPAFAHHTWKTPPTAGHYCLLVELIWTDDANPLNNIGQANTDVRPLNSPHAAFNFDIANDARVRHVYHFVVDTYTLPARPNCDTQPSGRSPRPTTEELRARARAARAENNPAAFPVPLGWQVGVDPIEAVLAPGESRSVTVDVTAPDGFSGSKTFNVHGLDEHGTLIGGVTLTVEG